MSIEPRRSLARPIVVTLCLALMWLGLGSAGPTAATDRHSSSGDWPASATLQLRLDAEAFRGDPGSGGVELRVLAAEPPLPLGIAALRPRLARGYVPFIAVQRRGRGGDLAVTGVPPGPHVVVVQWRAVNEGATRVARVAWRYVDAEAGEVHRLGTLRPTSARTEWTHRLGEAGPGGVADVSCLALARPLTRRTEVVPEVPAGHVAPLIVFDLELGATTRIEGLRARSIECDRALGPEDLAPGWALGPSHRSDAPGRARVECVVHCAVARTHPTALTFEDVPPGTAEVWLWARRDEGGPWWTATGAATANGLTVFEGELPLTVGDWRVLAQSRDGDSAPTGGAGEFALRVTGPGAVAAIRLPPAATLAVRAGHEYAGRGVFVRPVGWSVALAAGALGIDGRLVLNGLLAGAAHDVAGGARPRRVELNNRGQITELTLEP